MLVDIKLKFDIPRLNEKTIMTVKERLSVRWGNLSSIKMAQTVT